MVGKTLTLVWSPIGGLISVLRIARAPHTSPSVHSSFRDRGCDSSPGYVVCLHEPCPQGLCLVVRRNSRAIEAVPTRPPQFPPPDHPLLGIPPFKVRGHCTGGGTSSWGGLKSAFTPGAPSADFAPHHGHSAGRKCRSSALQNQALRALGGVHEKQSWSALDSWARTSRLRGGRKVGRLSGSLAQCTFINA